MPTRVATDRLRQVERRTVASATCPGVTECAAFTFEKLRRWKHVTLKSAYTRLRHTNKVDQVHHQVKCSRGAVNLDDNCVPIRRPQRIRTCVQCHPERQQEKASDSCPKRNGSWAITSCNAPSPATVPAAWSKLSCTAPSRTTISWMLRRAVFSTAPCSSPTCSTPVPAAAAVCYRPRLRRGRHSSNGRGSDNPERSANRLLRPPKVLSPRQLFHVPPEAERAVGQSGRERELFWWGYGEGTG